MDVTGMMFVRPHDSAPMKEKIKANMMERMVTPTFWPYCRPWTMQVKMMEARRPPAQSQ